MQRLGFALDWNREISTCEPEYYRWNQWFFLKMYERGLAYRKEALLNWCPECATVLANEQVVNGCCWRHETTPVEQRAMQQWFLRITAYAAELLADMSSWKAAGRSASLPCSATGSAVAKAPKSISRRRKPDEKIRVFTTRIDTIYGATCLILAPGHPLVDRLVTDDG